MALSRKAQLGGNAMPAVEPPAAFLGVLAGCLHPWAEVDSDAEGKFAPGVHLQEVFVMTLAVLSQALIGNVVPSAGDVTKRSFGKLTPSSFWKADWGRAVRSPTDGRRC